MILRKVGKPFTWTAKLKQVWIREEMGVVTGHDQVAIPMQSGKQAIFDIVAVKPIFEKRIDDKLKTALWLCTIEPKAYAV